MNLEEFDPNISGEKTDSSRKGKQANNIESRKDRTISELQNQFNAEKSMKEAAIKEKADLEKRIDELEKEKNLEEDELKERIAELEKQKIDEKKEKDDLLERNLKLEKENNEEKTMKNKYEKEKDDILDFLAREVTCSVCLMIPRTKRIPICRNGHTTCETCKR